jgi:hypothetical protein
MFHPPKNSSIAPFIARGQDSRFNNRFPCLLIERSLVEYGQLINRMKLDILSRVDVPPTSKLRWDHVNPEQRQWFCSHCQHHVHNLSAMTRREAEKLMRSPSKVRRCVSFLQEDCGKIIFRKGVPLFGSIGKPLTWFVSALFVLLASGCATSPQQQSAEKTSTVAESKTQDGQITLAKTEKRQRRWTGF